MEVDEGGVVGDGERGGGGEAGEAALLHQPQLRAPADLRTHKSSHSQAREVNFYVRR